MRSSSILIAAAFLFGVGALFSPEGAYSRRDPFIPDQLPNVAKKQPGRDAAAISLSDFNVQNTTVTGIAMGKSNRVAMLQDGISGGFLPAAEGSAVGKEGHTIAAIHPYRVVIIKESPTGKMNATITLLLKRRNP